MDLGRAVVLGCGAYLPDRVVPNREISDRVGRSEEWIVTRAGINQRQFAADGELTSDMSTQAALRALEAAEVDANDIDLIVLGTITPDHTFPATAAQVQANIGNTRGAAFDVRAACAGFLYAVSTANNAIMLGQAETALVIGTERMSCLLDESDPTTYAVFGDGAGAFVMKRGEGNHGGLDSRGVIYTDIRADGHCLEMLWTDGGTKAGVIGKIIMRGRDVFRHAVMKMSEIAEETLEKHDLTIDDIDWVIPHQANRRIIDGAAARLNLPEEKTIITVQDHANTSSASVPLAIDVAVRDGRIKRGDLLLMLSLGAGLNWAAALVRW
ncbi:MAG: beta-ketoacyl-ACP synthase III [Pseudomonadota bacterium]